MHVSLGYWSKTLLMGFKKNITERLKKYDVSFSEGVLLMMLIHKGPSSLVELANEVKNAHPSVLRNIDALEKRELIFRSPHPEDRRIKIISLTKEALDLADKVHSEFIEINQQALSGIDQADLEIVFKVYKQACNNLNIPDEDFNHNHKEVEHLDILKRQGKN